jgi:hypothetical protein
MTPTITLSGAELPEKQREATENLLLQVARSMDKQCADVAKAWEQAIASAERRFEKSKGDNK